MISQITQQLFKLVDVVNIADMTLGDHIERELLLLKLKVPDEHHETVRDYARELQARVLDDAMQNYTLEVTGSSGQLDEFVDRVGGLSDILAVVRSGPLSMARGRQVLSATI